MRTAKLAASLLVMLALVRRDRAGASTARARALDSAAMVAQYRDG